MMFNSITVDKRLSYVNDEVGLESQPNEIYII